MLTLYCLLNALYHSQGSVVTIWYQVQGRKVSKLKNVSLDDTDDLRRAIKKSSQLDTSADKLELYVKFPNSNQEDELDEDLLEKYGGFNKLLSKYEIGVKNPI